MEVRKVGVVGLGTMGAGIAQVCVQAGVETVGREVSEELAERARDRIAHYLGRGVEKGRLTPEVRDAALARLRTTTELADLAGCDLVVEAVVEELEAKRQLFRELEGLVAPEAVLATNTSALSVTEIASATRLRSCLSSRSCTPKRPPRTRSRLHTHSPSRSASGRFAARTPPASSSTGSSSPF